MTLEHVNPGENFAPSASAWNAFTDVARAYQAGELDGVAGRLPKLSSQVVVRAKNSGTVRDRFQILDLNDAVYTSADNEEEYKNAGPVVRISGPPVAGREAFVGVTTGPIGADQPGDIVVSGPVVAFVRGTGKYAWPVAGDPDAFATNDTGGFPIFDRGEEVDGKRIAYLLLTSRTSSADNSNTPPGLPATAYGCNCDTNVEGTAYHDCPLCGCINTTRYLYPPPIYYLLEGLRVLWAEASLAARKMRHIGNCVWVSDPFDGPYCLDEYLTQVRDRYRWIVDLNPDEKGCVYLRLERVSGTSCKPIKCEFTKVATCGTDDCTLSWDFIKGKFERLYAPEGCKACLTPEPPVRPNIDFGCFFKAGAGVEVQLPDSFPVPDWYMSNPDDTPWLPPAVTLAGVPDAGQEQFHNRKISEFAGRTFYVPERRIESAECGAGTPNHSLPMWQYDNFTRAKVQYGGIGGPGCGISPLYVNAQCFDSGVIQITAWLCCNNVYAGEGFWAPAPGAPEQTAIGPVFYKEFSITGFDVDAWHELPMTTGYDHIGLVTPDETHKVKVRLSGKFVLTRPLSSGHKGSFCGGKDTAACPSIVYVAGYVEGVLVWTITEGSGACTEACPGTPPMPSEEPTYEGETSEPIECIPNPE